MVQNVTLWLLDDVSENLSICSVVLHFGLVSCLRDKFAICPDLTYACLAISGAATAAVVAMPRAGP